MTTTVRESFSRALDYIRLQGIGKSCSCLDTGLPL